MSDNTSWVQNQQSYPGMLKWEASTRSYPMAQAYSEDVIPTDLLIEAYRRMLTIRKAEDAISADFRENKIFSFYHSSAGQEASAVGVCLALGKEDRVMGNHRSHGHYIAQGGNLYRMFAEIYGKADGCCKGKGGSMHMLDRDAGFMGTTPILGSIVPIATGSAFQQKCSCSDGITVAFLGDGASEEGAFYESINLAAVMQLPAIYVVEDNLYAVNTPRNLRRSENYSLGKVIVGLGAQYLPANGNSFTAMYTASRIAISHARECRPVVLHATVFRHMAHSGPIKDESVREIDTEGIRIQADPIKEIINQLHSRGISGISMEHEAEGIASQVAELLAKAKAAPMPASNKLFEGLYASR